MVLASIISSLDNIGIVLKCDNSIYKDFNDEPEDCLKIEEKKLSPPLPIQIKTYIKNSTQQTTQKAFENYSLPTSPEKTLDLHQCSDCKVNRGTFFCQECKYYICKPCQRESHDSHKSKRIHKRRKNEEWCAICLNANQYVIAVAFCKEDDYYVCQMCLDHRCKPKKHQVEKPQENINYEENDSKYAETQKHPELKIGKLSFDIIDYGDTLSDLMLLHEVIADKLNLNDTKMLHTMGKSCINSILGGLQQMGILDQTIKLKKTKGLIGKL